MNSVLSREEASCLKGYAILCIVLHNLLHLVGPLVKENEFYYNYNFRSFWMWDHLSHLHPNLVGDLFSFFGWYGVPVFIFLSGYGITKKYENPATDGSWGRFFGYNYRKLWMLMAPVYLVYLILGVSCWEKDFTLDAILSQFTLTINFLCDPKKIDPGVYWYFGLTMQLYLVYRLFFYRKTSRKFWISMTLLTVFSLVLCWFLQPDARQKLQPDYEYFSHNCIRWFLPFFLGIIWAKYDRAGKENWGVKIGGLLLSLTLLIACSFHQRLWLLTPLFAVGFFVSLIKIFIHVKPLKVIGCWLGGLSAYLFAAHPLVRPFFSEIIVHEKQLILDGRSWMLTGAYFVAVLLIAWLYRWFSTHYFVSFCEKIINSVTKWGAFKKK